MKFFLTLCTIVLLILTFYRMGNTSIPPFEDGIPAPGLGSEYSMVRMDMDGLHVRIDHQHPWRLTIPHGTTVTTRIHAGPDHNLLAAAIHGAFLPILIVDRSFERCYLILSDDGSVWSMRVRHGELASHSYLLDMATYRGGTSIQF